MELLLLASLDSSEVGSAVSLRCLRRWSRLPTTIPVVVLPAPPWQLKTRAAFSSAKAAWETMSSMSESCGALPSVTGILAYSTG